MHRLSGGDGCGDGAAVALHDQQLLGIAVSLETLGDAAEITGQHWLHEGVDGGRAAALEFPDLTQNLAARRDVVVGPGLARDLGGALFVLGIGVRMKEMDDDSFRVQVLQTLERRANLVFVERRHHATPGVDPLAHFEPEFTVDQSFELSGHAVVVRPSSATEFEHVAKALGGDQADPRAFSLEHRIGRDSGAVHHRGDFRQHRPGGLDRGHHSERLILRRRRHLGDPKSVCLGVE